MYCTATRRATYVPRLSARGACTCAGPPSTARPAPRLPVRGACTHAPVRPPQRDRFERLPARGVCTCAGPPTIARPAPRLPVRGACTCMPVRPPQRDRRRASPQGERAPARRSAYPQRVPAPRLPVRGACTRGRSALHSATGAAPPVRERAPAPVRPPQRDRRAPPRKGSVHLRRTTRTERVPVRASPQGECATAPGGPAGGLPAHARKGRAAPHTHRERPLLVPTTEGSTPREAAGGEGVLGLPAAESGEQFG